MRVRSNIPLLRALFLLPLLLLLSACQPPPAANVAGFMLAQRLDSLPSPSLHQPPGALEGRVLAGGRPLAGAVVLVAERTGQAHTATSDAAGRYRIENIPADEYVVAAVAPGYVESALQNAWGGPAPLRVRSGAVTFPLSLQLTENPEGVLPGMTASIAIVTSTAKNVLYVPTTAIQGTGTSTDVQVMVDGTPHSTPVSIGLSTNASTEIVSGVQAGQVVVTGVVNPVASTGTTGGVGGLTGRTGLGGGGQGGFTGPRNGG